MYDPFFTKENYLKNKNIFNSKVKFLENVKKNLKIDAIILNNKSKKILKIVNYYNKKHKTLIFDSRRVLDQSKFKNYLGVSLSNLNKLK
tara:strand:- start:340 stop:606 length:267 start_codon:yes stop_codon:yes gene_type:complete